MSRSKRKPFIHPFGCNVRRWQKEWMSSCHRAMRHSTKQQLKTTLDYENLALPILDEYANPWSSPRDNSKAHYWPEGPESLRRK